MEEKIKVLYTCGLCPIRNRAVNVPVRKDEDVTVWMASTIKLLVADHVSQSIACTATTFKEVKIPIAGTDQVGGPVVN